MTKSTTYPAGKLFGSLAQYLKHGLEIQKRYYAMHIMKKESYAYFEKANTLTVLN